MWQLLDTGVAFVRINENDDEDATSVVVAADDDGGDPPDRTLIFSGRRTAALWCFSSLWIARLKTLLKCGAAVAAATAAGNNRDHPAPIVFEEGE